MLILAYNSIWFSTVESNTVCNVNNLLVSVTKLLQYSIITIQTKSRASIKVIRALIMGYIHYFNYFSCTNVIVAHSNLSIIASIGMGVYNSPLKFQRDCICVSWDIAIMVFPCCTVEDKIVLRNINVWENHDFKNSISHALCVQSLVNFKGLL